jgi:hypothetical protein
VTTASNESMAAVSALPWPYGAKPAPDSASASAGRKVKSIQSAASRRSRPVQAADVAQARLFDDILQNEIAELEAIAESAERSWLSRRERGIGDDKLPEALVRLGERVAEAQQLLDALRRRFPHD